MDRLSLLGNKKKYKKQNPNVSILEVFENKNADQNYSIQIIFPEFTSLCPITGQPDFGTITITYVPDKKCLESKSLKMYLFSFRDHGSFMEEITNQILLDCVTVTNPRKMMVYSSFNPRGGMEINVTAEYRKE